MEHLIDSVYECYLSALALGLIDVGQTLLAAHQALCRRLNMPKNSKVGKMYDAMVKQGMDKGKAARIAQSKTGKSLKTGKAPKKNK